MLKFARTILSSSSANFSWAKSCTSQHMTLLLLHVSGVVLQNAERNRTSDYLSLQYEGIPSSDEELDYNSGDL